MPVAARRTRAAFTLVELMIVVAIIGILAMLAAYGVRKYIAMSKTTEARNALGRIGNAAIISYEDDEFMANATMTPGSSTGLTRQLCDNASQSVPSDISAVRGKKYQSTVADWSVDAAGNSGFACLKFTIDQPQYFLYTYAVSGTVHPGDSFTATAHGDLNGDGVQSTFALTGAITSSFVLNLAPNMLEVLADE
jgi:type IV pilus assembly protein PilA